MRKTGKRTPTLSAEPWPAREVSTRNCRHCLAAEDGVHVRCRKGYLMVGTYSRHTLKLTYNGVIVSRKLLKPCQGCPDFDNHWS